MEIIVKERKLTYHFWWHALPVIGLVLWGLLSITSNLWYDEAYSASLISRSWADMIHITAVDAHSPFYYGLLKLFYNLCGGGTRFWSLKLFSLLFMLGYLLLGKYLVRRLYGEKISVWFLFFSVTMPIMAVQATNARMYAAALFFMTLAGLTGISLFREPSVKKWLVFTLAGACTVYCHTFAMIEMVFVYLFLLGAILVSRKYKLIKGYFLSGLTVAVLYAPWLFVTYRQMQLRIDSGTAAAEIPTIYTFMDYCKEWFSALETPIPIVMFCGMAMTIFLGYYAVDAMRRQRDYAAGIGMAVIGLTALTGALVSLYVNPCFLGRYVFPGFGALALFLATGMESIGSVKIKAVAALLVTAAFCKQYQSELSLEYDRGLEAYESFFEENIGKDDAIMAKSEHTVFLNVYHPDMQYFIYGYMADKLPFVNTEAFTQWEQLEEIEGDLWYLCFQGDPPVELSERYDYEEALNFHYMYYDFSLYRMLPK